MRSPRIASADAAGVEAPALDRAASVLPEGLLQDDEVVVLLLRPSLLFIPLSSLTSLFLIALASVFLAYVARTQQAWIPWTDGQAFGFGLLVGFARLGWQALEWYGRVYVLTDRRIIRRMGVLRVAVFQTSLGNIQHTSVFAQLRERVFGLGTIGFATAGSDVFEAFWAMIRRPFAVHRTVVQAIERYGRRR